MKLRLAPALALILLGCGRPDIDGCEDYVRSGLRSPSTYNRISVKTDDRAATADEIKTLGGVAYGGSWAEHGLRTVIIEYDADNAFGTPIRSEAACLFTLQHGKLDRDASSIASSVALYKSRRDLMSLAETGVLPNVKPADLVPRSPHPCCL